MSDWQPIETIPMDGTEILALKNGVVHIGSFIHGSFWYHRYREHASMAALTHWMPLPAPPPEPVKPQPADPNTAYHRIPAPGQRVKVISDGPYNGVEVVVTGTYYFRNGRMEVETRYQSRIDVFPSSQLIPIGDKPKFILVPAE